jgi:demethylmenaquinone methyltransferase/2-methoxy-6-polyprenyl-1,4-benzoquinol methylase
VNKAPRILVAPVAADALELPLAPDTIAGAIVAFGIRNVASLRDALTEVYRVLEPGGRFVILEFSTPRSVVVRGAYHAYFHAVLPAVGRLVSGHRTAYRYLPESVARFPVQEELARAMRDAGFVDVRWESLTMGVAAIHSGDKPRLPGA